MELKKLVDMKKSKLSKSMNQSGLELLDESWSDSKSEGTTNFEEKTPLNLENAILQVDEERERTKNNKKIPYT